jgi:hypothetical protein
MSTSATVTATQTTAAISSPAPWTRTTTPATKPMPTESQNPKPGPFSLNSIASPGHSPDSVTSLGTGERFAAFEDYAWDRITPLVGTPVPAVTSTFWTSGTGLTDVPRTWRTASAIPFMPWM